LSSRPLRRKTLNLNTIKRSPFFALLPPRCDANSPARSSFLEQKRVVRSIWGDRTGIYEGFNPTLSRHHPIYFLVFTVRGVDHGVRFAARSCSFSAAESGIPMSKRGNGYGSETRVNILKKSESRRELEPLPRRGGA
jgi:hypothetical protein